MHRRLNSVFMSSLASESALYLHHATVFPDECHLGQADEQAMFYHARDLMQLAIQRGGIGDLAEVAVENVMPFVGDVNSTVVLLPQRDLRAERFNAATQAQVGAVNSRLGARGQPPLRF